MAKRQIGLLERAMRNEVLWIAESIDSNIPRKEVNEIAHNLVFEKSNADIWEALNVRIIEYLED